VISTQKAGQRSFAKIASDRDYAAAMLQEAGGLSYAKGLIQVLLALLILPVALVLWFICAVAIDFTGLVDIWGRFSGQASAA